MRSRELWLWLGGALLALGTVLAATALAYFTKEKHYSLIASPLMITAAASFILAFFGCFLGAIFNWPFPSRRLAFPNISIAVISLMSETVTFKRLPNMPQLIWAWEVHITNREQERAVSIKTARLRLRRRDGNTGSETISTGEARVPDFDSAMIHRLRFPVSVLPQDTKGGHFVFYSLDRMLADLTQSWIEIEDTHTGMWARFPATHGNYSKRHGLQILARSQLDTERYPLQSLPVKSPAARGQRATRPSAPTHAATAPPTPPPAPAATPPPPAPAPAGHTPPPGPAAGRPPAHTARPAAAATHPPAPAPPAGYRTSPTPPAALPYPPAPAAAALPPAPPRTPPPPAAQPPPAHEDPDTTATPTATEPDEPAAPPGHSNPDHDPATAPQTDPSDDHPRPTSVLSEPDPTGPSAPAT